MTPTVWRERLFSKAAKKGGGNVSTLCRGLSAAAVAAEYEVSALDYLAELLLPQCRECRLWSAIFLHSRKTLSVFRDHDPH